MDINLGPHLFSFCSFDHWCDTAKAQFTRHGVTGGKAICDAYSRA